jgi:hypothetical protein
VRKQPDRNADREPDAQAQHQARRRRQHIKSGIGNERRAPYAPWIVIRNVDQPRIYRRDQNLAIFRVHALLRRGEQATGLLRLKPHGLHRVHQIARLVVIDVAELLRPAIVARHIVEHGRKRGESFHAGIPAHAVGNAGALVRGQPEILLRPRVGLRDLIGIRGSGQNLRYQRVGIKCDGRNQLIQLHRVERHERGRLGVQIHLRQWNHQYGERDGQRLPRASVQGYFAPRVHGLKSFRRSY